jgi:hypothetical protein
MTVLRKGASRGKMSELGLIGLKDFPDIIFCDYARFFEKIKCKSAEATEVNTRRVPQRFFIVCVPLEME